jgi:hypothetical protein
MKKKKRTKEQKKPVRDERTDSLRYSVPEEATDNKRRGDGVLVDDDVDR